MELLATPTGVQSCTFFPFRDALSLFASAFPAFIILTRRMWDGSCEQERIHIGTGYDRVRDVCGDTPTIAPTGNPVRFGGRSPLGLQPQGEKCEKSTIGPRKASLANGEKQN